MKFDLWRYRFRNEQIEILGQRRRFRAFAPGGAGFAKARRSTAHELNDHTLAFSHARDRHALIWGRHDFPASRLDQQYRALQLDFFTMPADDWRTARLEITIYNGVTGSKARAALELMRLWFVDGPIPSDTKLKTRLLRTSIRS